VSRSRRSAINPVLVLVVAAAIPAIVLWMVWRWAGDRADAAADAVPVVDPDEAVVAVQPQPALSTSLMSYRRTADVMSVALNLDAFRADVVPLLESVNEISCVGVSLDGVPVGVTNEQLPVIPASNQKLLVAAAALDVLGPDFTYITSVAGPEPVGGVITGDVYLVGGGDPLLSGEWYPESSLDRFAAFNITSIDELARRLAAAGVQRIEGAVRGDGSRYDDEFYAPGWGGGVAGLEAGPYDALLVNDSRVLGDDQRGSDPNEAGAREFVRILGEMGIVVSGGASTGVAPAAAGELASVESMPLTAVVEEMLTNSDNNTAELMVKELGHATTGTGTRLAGLETIRSTLDGWGVDGTGLVLGDGSGLSLDNRTTCTTMMQVLQHVGFDSPVGAGLAIAAQTGTLTGVFEDTEVAGRLRGKTGTLNNPPFDEDPPAVKALSGYLPVDGGGAIEYSLLLNGPTISDQSEYRPIWEELVRALTSFPAVASPAELGPR